LVIATHDLKVARLRRSIRSRNKGRVPARNKVMNHKVRAHSHRLQCTRVILPRAAATIIAKFRSSVRVFLCVARRGRVRCPVFGTTAEAPMRALAQNNLAQIVIGMHNFQDTFGSLPAGYADKSGKLGLSWRVALLPFLEQDNLFKQFKLDEPWDSENNKKLIS